MLLCWLFGHPAPPQDVGMLALTVGGKVDCRRCLRVVRLERRAGDGRVVVKRKESRRG